MTEYDAKTISDTQLRENMTKMGKMDTSNFNGDGDLDDDDGGDTKGYKHILFIN